MYNNNEIIKYNYNLSKYKYIFCKNKKKSILLLSYYYFYYYKIIFNSIALNKLLKNTTNNILYICTVNPCNKKYNQFLDALYNQLHKCIFDIYNKKKKNKKNNKFIKKKKDYIYITKFKINSKNLLKILTLILSCQNINGSCSIILDNIDSLLLHNILYILSKKYKCIFLLNKNIELLTNFKYNKFIITFKNFKGINFDEINKICKFIANIKSKKINNIKLIELLIKEFNINKNKFKSFSNKLKKWKQYFNRKLIINYKNNKNILYNKKFIKNQINYCIYYCKYNEFNIKSYFLLYWNNKSKITNIKSSNSNILYYFPKIDNINYKNLQISNIGKYSITPNKDSIKINYILYNNIKKFNLNKIILTDATCGNGGNTIHFSLNFDKIIAIDKCKIHCKITENNVNVYNLKNVSIINDDYLNIMYNIAQDIIFLDPPWGGPSYKKYKNIKIYLSNLEISQIVLNILKKNIAKLIAIKVPYNYDFYSFYKKLNYKNINTINLQKCKLILIYGNTHRFM